MYINIDAFNKNSNAIINFKLNLKEHQIYVGILLLSFSTKKKHVLNARDTTPTTTTTSTNHDTMMATTPHNDK